VLNKLKTYTLTSAFLVQRLYENISELKNDC
jgi:hypothetical protein